MQLKTLKNGLKIYINKTSSPTVTVQANINTGSVYESPSQQGYSHYVEHMLFEGTKNRSNFEIANEVERIGGELNGATSTDRTYYYIKVPKKYAQIAIDILSDILLNPLFSQKEFDKEKQVILSEIDIYNDDPKLYQWILLEDNIFQSKLKLPVLGTKDSIKKCTRNKLINYHKKNYMASNVFFTITGNTPETLDFEPLKKFPKGKTQVKIKEPLLKDDKRITKKRETSQSYVNIGYKTTKRNDKDTIVLDIIHAYLGRGVSGKIFDEIRNKRGLGYSVYVYNEPGKYSGIFGAVVSTKKENLKEVEKIVSHEFKDVANISIEQLNEAKEYVLGKMEMESEDTRLLNDRISAWIAYSDLKTLDQYRKNIKNTTLDDIKRVAKKYFTNKVIAAIKEK